MTDPPAQVIPFKVIGLQRTGTNLMVALLARNFHVHSLEIGAEWKHGPVEQPDRRWNHTPARFVLCVKDPYAWLASCFRYFRVAIGTDSTVAPQFVRNSSMPFEEFVLTPSYEFASPVHRWNHLYKLWLATLPMDGTIVVRQEDQMENQIEVMAEAQRKLGLTPLGPLQVIAQHSPPSSRAPTAHRRRRQLGQHPLVQLRHRHLLRPHVRRDRLPVHRQRPGFRRRVHQRLRL
jgi:hypothetical protein